MLTEAAAALESMKSDESMGPDIKNVARTKARREIASALELISEVMEKTREDQELRLKSPDLITRPQKNPHYVALRVKTAELERAREAADAAIVLAGKVGVDKDVEQLGNSQSIDQLGKRFS